MARRLSAPTDLEKSVHEFLFNRDAVATAEPAKNKARDVIKGWLTVKNAVGKMTNGRVDENGHRFLDFEQPLTVNDVTYTGIKAERKTSTSIDLEAAEELARDKGLYDKIFKRTVIRVFDEDALFLASQKGLISEDELDALAVESESFSLVVVKE